MSLLQPDSDYNIDTKQAKKDYFLTASDLANLPFEKLGGWGGWGNRRYYNREHLKQAALRKHGLEGLREKRYRRAVREANKQCKIQKARQAQKRLLEQQQQDVVDLSDENTKPASNVVAAPAVAVDAQVLKTLRNDIKRSFKPYLTWHYLRTKNSPNGTFATVRLSRIQQTEYCALTGRTYDVNLETLVKKGAWYSVDVPFETVFGSSFSIVGSGGRYNCNSDLGVDPSSKLTLKYAPSNQTLSVTAYVQHRDTFGYEDEDE